MIGIGVTATLVASTPFVIAYAAGAATESLLSQGRTATSSSVETSSLGPANAVDGTAWKSIYSTSTGNGATDDLAGLSGSGRFVRVLGTKRGTPYGYSLYEFQVFGLDGSTPSPSSSEPGSPDPTASPSDAPPT